MDNSNNKSLKFVLLVRVSLKIINATNYNLNHNYANSNSSGNLIKNISNKALMLNNMLKLINGELNSHNVRKYTSIRKIDCVDSLNLIPKLNRWKNKLNKNSGNPLQNVSFSWKPTH
jgi:hypothetical protein